MTVELIEGDCRVVLKELADNSVDSVVTDPPYGLEFMGKEWDSFARSKPYEARSEEGYGHKGVLPGYGRGGTSEQREAYRRKTSNAFQEWCETWAAECLRVLKPGGHLLAFGGSRTYHRMASAVEDAGFEIRDQIMWLYGSGFPKSSNQDGDWEGWGTALKPAHEPIVMARKPLIGTVPANLAAYGVGALNIDGCRVPTDENLSGGAYAKNATERDQMWGSNAGNSWRRGQAGDFSQPEGRWPANIIHDGSDDVLAAFPEARGQIADASSSSDERKTQHTYGQMRRGNDGAKARDTGGSAARFFYCAKASKADRDDGMTTEEKPVVTFATANGTSGKPSSISEGRTTSYKNTHPTVKPTDLMRYLCRLVTPPGGTVLDPFMGSGSTGRGAVLEGFNFIGVEMDAGYFDIADARIAAAELRVAEKMQAAE